jgi:exodeoxyribonuclease V alpha subunit
MDDAKPQAKEILVGVLERIRFSGANGFLVGDFRPQNGALVPVVGKLFGVRSGDTIRIEGEFIQDPRFGRQFQVQKARALFPEDEAGTIRFLERLPFVGQSRAVKLTQKLGVKGVFALLDDPAKKDDWAAVDALLTAPRVEAIYRAYGELKGQWGAQEDLGAFGLSDSQVAQALTAFGKDAVEKIKKDPYLLTAIRIPFGEADRIAQKMGFVRDHVVRLRAAAAYVLSEEELAGHTFLDAQELALKVARLLEVDWDRVSDTIRDAVSDHEGPLADSGEGRVHLRELYDAESEISRWLKS